MKSLPRNALVKKLRRFAAGGSSNAKKRNVKACFRAPATIIGENSGPTPMSRQQSWLPAFGPENHIQRVAPTRDP